MNEYVKSLIEKKTLKLCGLLAAACAFLLIGCTEKSEIFVEAVEDLPEDYLMGVDISSVLSEEASGVKYYDEKGREKDLFKILADSGVNCIRVRVWNDPYDENHNGYGGGNCDVNCAKVIGKRAKDNGMKLCVDFHYSDFWADPKKQMAPKAWEGMNLEEKQQAIYEYTKQSLMTIKESGADICMVQIGNETNNGMSGETLFTNEVELLKFASKAVREVVPDALVTVHFTNIEEVKNIRNKATLMASMELDYDVLGFSFYPYWHGSLENMTQVLGDITKTFGKKTCIMETAYPYTAEDGDANGNSIEGSKMNVNWPVSVQGQANAVRDVMAASVQGGAIGCFYWEPAWCPVGSERASNEVIWEKYGSGWASSYAAGYDPKDAGLYYGGSSWDNQAMFDFSGKKLASLDVFKYAKSGIKGEKLQIIWTQSPFIEVGVGEEIILPETVDAMYNDSSVKDAVAVDWLDADKLDSQKVGTYDVVGTCRDEDKTEVHATVKIANMNYVKNADFETGDLEGWQSDGPMDNQDKAADALSSSHAAHFYSTGNMDFDFYQEIENVKPGTYKAVGNIQGGDVSEDAVIYMYIKSGDEELYRTENIVLSGWQQWKPMEIEGIKVPSESNLTLGVHITAAAKGWGTMDDFELYMTE